MFHKTVKCWHKRRIYVAEKNAKKDDGKEMEEENFLPNLCFSEKSENCCESLFQN